MTSGRAALVIVQSTVIRDPRVVREIEWLRSDGWTVDCVGLGPVPVDGITHFEMAPRPRWSMNTVLLGLIYLLPRRARFRLLTESRIPRAAGERIARGHYDLILFNDTHLLPWTLNRRVFTPAAQRAHLHLDLHEYFAPDLAETVRFRRVIGSMYRWTRNVLRSPIFTTRSVVASGIAELYAEELGGDRPAVIRNTPPFEDLTPSAVEGDRINLIHHGAATWPRGLREMVDAVRLLDDRFTLTLMLVGYPEIVAQLRAEAADLGDRVRFVDPVPMLELSREINQYDLEVMFFPPSSRSLHFALPNKLFEAVQGRLGLVIGPSPMMAEIIAEYDNGIVVDGFTPEDLARGLSALTRERVIAMKAASHRAAHELSAEQERERFLALVSAPTASGEES